MFQYGVESWHNLLNGTARIFVEYADLTSTWWTDDSRKHNISYGHHIYSDGFRYLGRPVGHWADTDSKIISFGGFLQYDSGVGWGSILRTGEINEDDSGYNSVSNGVASDYFAIEVFNSRSYDSPNLDIQTSLGWEEIEVQSSSLSVSGITFSATITKIF
jgi:hypothetical protein